MFDGNAVEPVRTNPLRLLFCEVKASDSSGLNVLPVESRVDCFPREAIYSSGVQNSWFICHRTTSLGGKKHESENVRSASDRISRRSIASNDSASVRRKPSSSTRQPFTRNRAMHLHTSNLASNPSLSQRQRRTRRPVISLSPNAHHTVIISKQSSMASPISSPHFFLEPDS